MHRHCPFLPPPTESCQIRAPRFASEKCGAWRLRSWCRRAALTTPTFRRYCPSPRRAVAHSPAAAQHPAGGQLLHAPRLPATATNTVACPSQPLLATCIGRWRRWPSTPSTAKPPPRATRTPSSGRRSFRWPASCRRTSQATRSWSPRTRPSPRRRCGRPSQSGGTSATRRATRPPSWAPPRRPGPATSRA